MGGRRVGAMSILLTIGTGLITWFLAIAKGDIPNIHSNIAVLQSEMKNNNSQTVEIKEDLRVLRVGQTKILELLIQR